MATGLSGELSWLNAGREKITNNADNIVNKFFMISGCICYWILTKGKRACLFSTGPQANQRDSQKVRLPLLLKTLTWVAVTMPGPTQEATLPPCVLLLAAPTVLQFTVTTCGLPRPP